MNLYNPELMYEFQTNDIVMKEAFRQSCDHAVREIKSIYGWDTEVQVNVQPTADQPKSFLISMAVFGLGESIVVTKEGRNMMSVLRKVKKSVMRKIHDLSQRAVNHRRKIYFREQETS